MSSARGGATRLDLIGEHLDGADRLQTSPGPFPPPATDRTVETGKFTCQTSRRPWALRDHDTRRASLAVAAPTPPRRSAGAALVPRHVDHVEPVRTHEQVTTTAVGRVTQAAHIRAHQAQTPSRASEGRLVATDREGLDPSPQDQPHLGAPPTPPELGTARKRDSGLPCQAGLGLSCWCLTRWRRCRRRCSALGIASIVDVHRFQIEEHSQGEDHRAVSRVLSTRPPTAAIGQAGGVLLT